MIDLTQIQKSPYSTTVQPDNNIYKELGKNTYDYKDLLSELIDNSIAARNPDRLLVVTIDIYVNRDSGEPTKFTISDNASGISDKIMGEALSPAAIQSSNSLNEHGLGMKQAIAALGTLEYLATKTEDEDKGRLVQELRFGDLPTYYVDMPTDSGTEISVVGLEDIVTTHATSYTRTIVPYLGARYRRFLIPDRPLLELTINLRDDFEPYEVQNTWAVEQVKPVYFHPSTRTNRPSFQNYDISGDGWKATLTFGYAPRTAEEYGELGLQEPNTFHPYRISQTTQGLDILLHDRVILFHQLAELDLVGARHPDYNDIRGEINLIEGFSTAITKNSMIRNRNFNRCIDRVKAILQGEAPGPDNKMVSYLERKTYPEQIPERLMRDRLAEWLRTNPMHAKQDVKVEYVLEGLEGFIDILADGEVWEIKTDHAKAYDVYQLFMYMDIGDFDKGYLVAETFSTGANVAEEHINQTHGKEIILTSKQKFPINHRPDALERETYY